MISPFALDLLAVLDSVAANTFASAASYCQLCDDLAQEGALLRKDEFTFFREIEIRHAFPRRYAVVRDRPRRPQDADLNEISAAAMLLVPLLRHP